MRYRIATAPILRLCCISRSPWSKLYGHDVNREPSVKNFILRTAEKGSRILEKGFQVPTPIGRDGTVGFEADSS
jgi:hypothetical protein